MVLLFLEVSSPYSIINTYKIKIKLKMTKIPKGVGPQGFFPYGEEMDRS